MELANWKKQNNNFFLSNRRDGACDISNLKWNQDFVGFLFLVKSSVSFFSKYCYWIFVEIVKKNYYLSNKIKPKKKRETRCFMFGFFLSISIKFDSKLVFYLAVVS